MSSIQLHPGFSKAKWKPTTVLQWCCCNHTAFAITNIAHNKLGQSKETGVEWDPLRQLNVQPFCASSTSLFNISSASCRTEDALSPNLTRRVSPLGNQSWNAQCWTRTCKNQKKTLMIIKGRLQGTCKIIELIKLHNITKRSEKSKANWWCLHVWRLSWATTQDPPEATLQGHRLKALGRGAVAALQLTDHPALPWHVAIWQHSGGQNFWYSSPSTWLHVCWVVHAIRVVGTADMRHMQWWRCLVQMTQAL